MYGKIFDESLEIDNLIMNISTLIPNTRTVPGERDSDISLDDY